MGAGEMTEGLFDLAPVEVKRVSKQPGEPNKGRDRSAEPPPLIDVARSPYRVPSLGEVLAGEGRTGLTAVSTFSGCGGSSLGLKMAGFRVPYAVEFIPAARETYLANFPDVTVDDRDIREIDPLEVLHSLGLEPGELDLFEGSPPCSSFSTMNKEPGARYGSGKVKNYSGKQQATDDLFEHWLRFVEVMRPRAVLAENVPALAHEGGAAAEFFEWVLGTLDRLGYAVRHGIYGAHHYGSATSRRRLVIYGVRREAGIRLPLPPARVSVAHTAGEALAALPQGITPADEFEWATLRERLREAWDELKPGQLHGYMIGVQKAAENRPLPGITAAGQSEPLHWAEPRKFTPTEVKWMFGFPADFALTGSPSQRYERVGRSVAPPLYRAMGEVLATALNEGKRS